EGVAGDAAPLAAGAGAAAGAPGRAGAEAGGRGHRRHAGPARAPALLRGPAPAGAGVARAARGHPRAHRGRGGMRTALHNDGADLTVELRGAAGAAPVLVVGPGPGFPLLHEARAVERLLGLDAWQAAYLEQRGCGRSRGGAQGVERSIGDVAAAA